MLINILAYELLKIVAGRIKRHIEIMPNNGLPIKMRILKEQIEHRIAVTSERNVYNRVRRFLVNRHTVCSRGIHRYHSERVFGELGVMLPRPIKPAVLRVP
jgi:hypothetical protein